MAQQTLALHEMMEVHEVLNFKTICGFKSKMMVGLARDEDLKALLEQDAQQSMADIQAILALYPKPTQTPTQTQ